MSLKNRTISDWILNKLLRQTWEVTSLAIDVWMSVNMEGKEVSLATLKKIKELALKLTETCEELP